MGFILGNDDVYCPKLRAIRNRKMTQEKMLQKAKEQGLIDSRGFLTFCGLGIMQEYDETHARPATLWDVVSGGAYKNA